MIMLECSGSKEKSENLALDSSIISLAKSTNILIEKNGPVKAKANQKEKSLGKDTKTIVLLMYLYFLQGLPIGLASAIMILLSSKKVSYSDQGMFSFVFWPFSLKLLWAPIVDSVYITRFGRRKSWLVTVQLILSALMLALGSYCEYLVDNVQNKQGFFYLHPTLINKSEDFYLSFYLQK
jgi:hypothetical protein